MPRELSHREIAERFLQSGALNFEAMGTFVSESGPELLVGDGGLHGVSFGRWNMLACYMRPDEAARLIGDLFNASQVAAAINARAEADQRPE
jgi:hypothetical protein